MPPPRSNTNTVSSPSTSTPYASAAAMGSRSSFTVVKPARCPARTVASHWLSSKYAGTVITAFSIGSPPSRAEASARHRATMKALISSGLTFLPSAGHRTATNPAPFRDGPKPWRPIASASASTVAQTSYGTRRASSATFLSLKRLPMKRFTEWNVFLGSLVRRFAATCPTATEPSAAKCTTLGIVRRPFSSGTSTGRPSITTATQLLVVPRSMPQMEAWTEGTVGGRARATPRARWTPRRRPDATEARAMSDAGRTRADDIDISDAGVQRREV